MSASEADQGSDSNATRLRLESVARRFATPDGEPLTIFEGLDLTVRAGESVAIVGPSGSGKSTLLQLMGGLDQPDEGRVIHEGVTLGELDEAALASHRNHRVGFVFQFHHLLPQCTALENVLLPCLAEQDRIQPEQRERAESLLERVGLAERRNHPPARLSGGERQRVAVVRALIQEPGLVLADEPTGSLDQSSSGRLSELLLELVGESGTSLVVVTHAPTLAARLDRSLELRDRTLAPLGPALSDESDS